MATINSSFQSGKTPYKLAGVAIPVFSLRRKTGYGVGEFTDIKLLVDWANKVNIKVIQILPINDTVATHTWVDSYPYSGISVFALHPVYVNISLIGKLKSKITQTIIEEQGQFLNSLPKLDYEAVMRLKSRFFKEIYDEQQRSFLNEKEYKLFFEKNMNWLRPYAAFSYLRDLYSTTDFNRWGRYSKFTPDLLNEICNPSSDHFDDIAIHYFIQYHAYKQLLDASLYAKEKGVALKGDLPVGIQRNSVDAWVQPELFNMDEQAGAPPDDFSVTGQNWKFPTYNWDRMAKDNYHWWQTRLHNMSQFFDAFRIDHILGFFRIWEIPNNQVEGLLGRFNPSLSFTVKELEDKGMWFNYDRLCRPYIREHFLYELFGDYTAEVRNLYLDEYASGQFTLKSNFDTQKKIEKAFEFQYEVNQQLNSKNEHIRRGLFQLVTEVIFLEAPEGINTYVPRFYMHSTKSYQELDQFTKDKLNEIYYDYFYHRNEQFWSERGKQKLPYIKNATDMLVCGEDLGMVPQCVPEIMADLGILGLEIQRMPKRYGLQFADTYNYPYMSVASTSTHDTLTLRGWWEENPARSQQFYSTILNRTGNSPFFCETWIVKQIIEQHLQSPSMLAIFPIQDLLGLSEKLRYQDARDERINNPANPAHYWRYRMHLDLEDLINEDDFNRELLKMIELSGR